MKINGFKILAVSAVTMIFCSTAIFAQTNENSGARRNSPLSPNPKKKIEATQVKPEEKAESAIKQTVQKQNPPKVQTIAEKTLEISKRKKIAAAQPTEIYRVGAGDVLDIKILNSPAKDSTLFTVLPGGKIEYPPAGEDSVNVADLTPEEIEILLSEKVKIYDNAEVTVTVREFASRKISIFGLVERPGTKVMRRVALPLYAVLAEAIPLSNANKISITRAADKQTVAVSWEDTETLVYEGDVIRVGTGEIKSETDAAKFYYIGGEIGSGGQKEFHEGITLTQAILSNGGLKKNSVRKVVVRRKNSEGLLVSTEYDLKAIKDGKIADPQLQSGDTIEIGNR